MNSRLYTIAEYAAFIRRRRRFIVAGTLLVVVMVGTMSLMLPDVYSSSATIDAGTLGSLRGNDIDSFRKRFNGGEYRTALSVFPPERVTKVWMEYGSRNISLRVDALDGQTAATAATRLVSYLIAELTKIPIFRPGDIAGPPASAEETRAIRASLQVLEERVAAEIDRTLVEQSRFTADRDRILASMRARDSDNGPAKAKQRSLLADRLSQLIDANDRRQQQIVQFQVARARLQGMLAVPVSRAAVPRMRKILEVRPSSTEPFDATVDELHGVLSSTILEPPPAMPPKVVEAPQVPTSPAWPRPALNMLIAALFGLVGSSFAALLLEYEARE